eukprot:6631459-Alexandrium_andersonii.AAC.1
MVFRLSACLLSHWGTMARIQQCPCWPWLSVTWINRASTQAPHACEGSTRWPARILAHAMP